MFADIRERKALLEKELNDIKDREKILEGDRKKLENKLRELTEECTHQNTTTKQLSTCKRKTCEDCGLVEYVDWGGEF